VDGPQPCFDLSRENNKTYLLKYLHELTVYIDDISRRSDITSASSWEPHLLGAQACITQFYLQTHYTHLPLSRSSPEGATTEWTVIAPADKAYYWGTYIGARARSVLASAIDYIGPWNE